MKTGKLFLSTALVLIHCVGPRLQAQTSRQLTTTLLPVNSQDLRAKGLLIQNDPPLAPVLKFDLSAIPPGLTDANFLRCTLRLIADDVANNPDHSNTRGAQPVIIKGRIPGVASSVVSLSAISDQPARHIALQSNEALRNLVYGRYSEKGSDKVLSIQLFTDTRRASSTFLTKAFSDVPRLVIEYTLPSASLLEDLSWRQAQHDPEHTGRTPWISSSPPTGFVINEVKLPAIGSEAGSVADYPLIYQGNIYLIYQAAKNYLVCLDFTGRNKLWEKEIRAGTIQRSPVINSQGILFAATEEHIAAYDLNKNGELIGQPYPLPGKLSNSTDLTAANDGSLFLAVNENSLNYIYGFTSNLVPFLKAGPFEKNISSITVNTAGNKIFAETAEGGVTIELADPSKQLTLPLENAWEYYHSPVAAPDNVMVFSDFTSNANKGNVRGYGATEIWNSPGTLIPQPVISGSSLVYFIQGGKLQGRRADAVGPAIITAGNGLNTTSNLLMDGGNNVYFWSNKALNGYNAAGEPLFAPTASPASIKERDTTDAVGPEKFLRLMMDPAGTAWANNKGGNALYAFQPVYAQQDLAVSGQMLAKGEPGVPRVYRATGNLSVPEGGATLKAGTATLFQAGNSIRFSKGFRVETGASLLCRTGQ